ncbi:MAG: response regulator transcription factor [Oscillospiraceae bacterium]|jgi:DNA-binding response OmpR family regulator|nr:response regulator transcription factor [Oscillospiraceae bacterium]
MKILLVEDEKYTEKALAEILKKNHYDADVVFDGEDGLAYGLTGVYDVIILDIMLPKKDGLSVLRELRGSRIGAPVILLTAKGEPEDKVKGLDAGADDYLSKPFHSAKLLARLRALQRRKPELLGGGVLSFDDISLSPHTLILSCGGRETKLKPKEARLLELLIDRRNSVVSKNTILEKVWGFDTEAEDNHVETHISRLRKALESIGAKTAIRTIRGEGYALAERSGGHGDV